MRIALIALFFTFSTISFGQIQFSKYGVDSTKHIPVGLNIGDKAPTFSGIDQYGNNINSDSLLKKGSVVLFFYRGHWCPLCNKYLSNLQDSLSYIESRNATVVAVAVENSKGVGQTILKTKSEFVILSDTTNVISEKYDVLFFVPKSYSAKISSILNIDISTNNSSSESKLPVPATFVISKKGIITYKYFNFNYGKRANVIDIIGALESDMY